MQSDKSLNQIIIISSGLISLVISIVNAEATNLIFRKKIGLEVRLLSNRFKLLIPVFLISSLTCFLYHRINLVLLLILALRKTLDWLDELFICTCIKNKKTREINVYLIGQITIISIIFLEALLTSKFSYFTLAIWAIFPLFRSLININKAKFNLLTLQNSYKRIVNVNINNYYISSITLSLSTLLFRFVLYKFMPLDFTNKLIAILSIAGISGALLTGVLGSAISYKFKDKIYLIYNNLFINLLIIINLIIAFVSFILLSVFNYLLQENVLLIFVLIISFLASLPMAFATLIRNYRIQKGELMAKHDIFATCAILLTTLFILKLTQSHKYISLIYIFSSLINVFFYAKNK